VALIQIRELKWRKLVQEFSSEVMNKLKEKLISFIASYDPDVTVHGYNVVLVVDKPSEEDRKVVRRIAREVERVFGVGIMIVPEVTEKDSLLEREARNIFLKSEDIETWNNIISEYEKKINKLLGSRLISFIASYDPDVTVHGYNVVLVVDKPSEEDRKVVRRIAREVERVFGVGIMIVPEVTEKDSLLQEEASSVFRAD